MPLETDVKARFPVYEILEKFYVTGLHRWSHARDDPLEQMYRERAHG